MKVGMRFGYSMILSAQLITQIPTPIDLSWKCMTFSPMTPMMLNQFWRLIMLRLYRTDDIIQGVRSRRVYLVTAITRNGLHGKDVTHPKTGLGPALLVNHLAPKLEGLC